MKYSLSTCHLLRLKQLNRTIDYTERRMSTEQTEKAEMQNKEWHCLRTQIKREHIAAALLDRLEEVEVFCPRISQVKKTRNGKKRFVEAMFPGYIFAKFCFNTHSRQVVYSQGISKMVELGDRRVIPERVVNDLKENLPEGIIEAPDLSVKLGAEVEFITGMLKGLNGKVLAQLNAQNRIKILLELLGREITVEVNSDDILLFKDS